MINDLQELLLKHLSICADHYSCIERMYLFGSIARGDHRADSDADIFVIYGTSRGTEFVISYSNWQNASEAWAEDLSKRCGHKVHIHGGHIGDAPDAALAGVLLAAKNPAATRGKAAIVLTEGRATLAKKWYETGAHKDLSY